MNPPLHMEKQLLCGYLIHHYIGMNVGKIFFFILISILCLPGCQHSWLGQTAKPKAMMYLAHANPPVLPVVDSSAYTNPAIEPLLSNGFTNYRSIAFHQHQDSLVLYLDTNYCHIPDTLNQQIFAAIHKNMAIESVYLVSGLKGENFFPLLASSPTTTAE